MPIFESESFVLKSFNLAEADRIVVFYTRDFGIIRGVAKGVKRLNSKFGSTLEPFSTVKLTYFQKEDRELVSIQNAELLRSAFSAASDPGLLTLFSYLSELLIAFQPPNDPNEIVYRMIRSCLETSIDSEEEIAALALYFEMWLLRLGGYMPDWSLCRDCGKGFPEGKDVIFADGTYLYCVGCGKNSGSKFSWGLRELYVRANRQAPADFVRSAGPFRENVVKMSAILKRMITQSIGREVSVASAAEGCVV